jgi:hypothetical protein
MRRVQRTMWAFPHTRGSGCAILRRIWIPAFAGMTEYYGNRVEHLHRHTGEGGCLDTYPEDTQRGRGAP